MKRQEYFERAQQLLENNKIDEDVFWAMMDNADSFCDEDDEDDWLPETYAEVEYGDRLWDDPEAIDGAKWDDMNYMWYMER